MRRWTGLVAALALVTLGMVLAGPAPEAAAAVPGARSWFVQGDLFTTGNGLGYTNAPVDQDAVAGSPGLPSSGTAATVRSSSATLDLPAGSTVVSASVYFFQTSLTGPAGTAVTSAQVSAAGGPYGTVALDDLGLGTSGGVQARTLRGDATSALASVTGSVPLWVGITSTTSIWAWSMQVVYSNPASGWHQITIVDMAQGVNPVAAISATVPTILVEPGTRADARVSTFALFSTLNQADNLRVCAGTSACPDLTAARTAANGYAFDATNPVNDVQNKTWTRNGVPHAGMLPAPSTVDGRFASPSPNVSVSVDLDVFDLTDVLPDSATSATVTMNTLADTLYAGVVSLSVPTFTPLPQLTTTVTAPPVGSPCDPCEVDVVQALQLGAAGSNGYSAAVTTALPAGVVLVGTPVTSTPGDPVSVATGTITWSPGTVVAGAVARTMTYRISLPRSALVTPVVLTANGTMQGPAPLIQAFTATSSATLSAYPALVSVSGLALPTGTTAASACSTTDVVLTGTDLVGATVAVSGRVLATRPGAAGSLVVSLPAGLPPGPVVLDVTAVNGARATAGTTVATAPTLVGASPAAGPLGGGAVRLTGSGLVGVTTVVVDGVPVPVGAVAPDGSWVSAVLPAHGAGGVLLGVPVPGTACTPTTAYRYAAPPVVTAVRAAGTVDQGGRITITGTDLTGATVTVGGLAAPVVVEEPGRLVVRAPRGLAAGRFVVDVRTPGGEALGAGTVLVSGAGGQLALTGTPVAAHVGLALLALVVGAGVTRAGRRTPATQVPALGEADL